jgi:hypothetical protein
MENAEELKAETQKLKRGQQKAEIGRTADFQGRTAGIGRGARAKDEFNRGIQENKGWDGSPTR